MKGVDMAEISMDKLLDFSTDVGEEDDDDDKTRRALAISSSSLPERREPFPETEEEEELEWLSNKDAFPEVESLMDIFSFVMPAKFAKQRSPVSVLETSNGGGATSGAVRWRTGLRVPVKARTNLRRRRRRAVDHSWPCAPRKNTGVVGKAERPGQLKAGGGGRKCVHCQSEKTPQWRAGPEGPKTLCNACGVRFKSGRLVPEYRPASSPTFSEELHSNSHRKIMEMRRVNQTVMG